MSTQIARQETRIETWLVAPSTISQLRAALPSHFAPERMARLALTSLRTVRGLAECDTASIMACVMTAAQLGLEPGVMGSCYLIPRRTKNGPQCTLIIGYQGLLDLIRRSGQVKSIASRVVYEGDTFEIDYASEVPFVHKPDLRRTKKTPMIGFYCHAILTSGEHVFEWMNLEEVQAIRARSQSKDDGPWVTDFSEMARKTVLRRAAKYLPRSIEFADAITADDRNEYDHTPAPALAPQDVEHTEVRSSPSLAARLPAPPPAPEPIEQVEEVAATADDDADPTLL